MCSATPNRNTHHTGQTPIRVGLVDNDDCVLQWLRMALRSHGINVVWAEKNSGNAIQRTLFGMDIPQVVVTDIVLDLISGVRLCEEIRRHNSTIGIIGITSYTTKHYEKALARAGAQGLLDKNHTIIADLIKAIPLAACGLPIDQNGPFLDAQTAHRFVSPSSAGTIGKLSAAETAILRLYDRHYSTQEVADLLDMNPRTVSTHISRAMRKLGAKDRYEALRICSRYQLLN